MNMICQFPSISFGLSYLAFWYLMCCVEEQVYGLEKLHSALLQRPKGKPLLTVRALPSCGMWICVCGFNYLTEWLVLIIHIQVSNHVASMDDPLVIASLLPPSVLLDARNLRWTLCATDRCFKNPVTSAFFRSVKVLPVSRGDGIYQEVWIHRQ